MAYRLSIDFHDCCICDWGQQSLLSDYAKYFEHVLIVLHLGQSCHFHYCVRITVSLRQHKKAQLRTEGCICLHIQRNRLIASLLVFMLASTFFEFRRDGNRPLDAVAGYTSHGRDVWAIGLRRAATNSQRQLSSTSRFMLSPVRKLIQEGDFARSLVYLCTHMLQ